VHIGDVGWQRIWTTVSPPRLVFSVFLPQRRIGRCHVSELEPSCPGPSQAHVPVPLPVARGVDPGRPNQWQLSCHREAPAAWGRPWALSPGPSQLLRPGCVRVAGSTTPKFQAGLGSESLSTQHCDSRLGGRRDAKSPEIEVDYLYYDFIV
jgi:hypothetical protein